MTDHDDELSRRYRETAHEEPPAHIDAAILAAARTAVENRGRTPESAREGSRKTGVRPQWMVPTSIAAVLVLGIGVSLRMQMEKPGVETSVPGSSAEYPVPSDEPPVAATQPSAAAPAPLQPVPQPKVKAEAKVQVQPGAKPRSQPQEQLRDSSAARDETPKQLAKRDAPQAPEAAPVQEALRKDAAVFGYAEAPLARQERAPAAPPAPARTTTTIATPPPPPPAPQSAPVAPAAPAATAAAPAPAPQAALRAKTEGYAADRAAVRESRALAAVADPDPVRELERIARLREADRHVEANRALEEFRRRHPDFRIPEATWERVKPR